MLVPIDWSRAWYDSVRPASARLQVGAEGIVGAFNADAARVAPRNAAGMPVRFVPQSELPEGVAYEAHIAATGCVPTRENLHDFFNALVWLSFPRIKQQLNALQAAQIVLAGVGKSRGPARDAATIFDENAALLVVRDAPAGHALAEALRTHDWRAAFRTQRDAFGRDAEVWLFGHALMEKLVAPYKAITAHTRVIFADDAWFALDHDARRAWIDEQVARQLAVEGLSTAAFTPLPVLGVPGWWPDQDDDFYADTTVFRPKRKAAEPQH